MGPDPKKKGKEEDGYQLEMGEQTLDSTRLTMPGRTKK